MNAFLLFLNRPRALAPWLMGALLLFAVLRSVAQAPTITSLSPSSGPAGSSFTLNGTNLNVGGLNVTVDGTSATLGAITATTAVVWVPTTIGTGAKQVMCSTNGGSTWPNFATFTITVPAPTITSFTPTSGSAADFTTVVVNGTNFSNVTDVSFNNVSVASGSWMLNSSTQLQTTVPAAATTGKIRVTTAGGTAVSTADFTVTGTPTGQPTVTSFSPTLGVAGTSVTLTGTNFTGATFVKFNATTTTAFTVNSPTSITVTVPNGASTGKISVANSGGFGPTSTASFTVGFPPTISSFTPTSGAAGTSVTITGTVFTGATAVKFNGVAATSFTVNSSSSITATVPSGSATGKVSVTTAFGTATSTGNFTVAAPTVGSFTPTSGGAGTVVTITGTNFTGATGVKFNTTTATSFTVNSATSITATVPSGATTGKVSVTTAGGTAQSTANFTMTPAPTVTSFTPGSGSAGTGINITGTDFTGATGVKFNTTSATNFTVNSATSITAYVPTGATTGKISVTTPGGTGQSATNFTIQPVPTISSFSPTSGQAGITVTITGTNFTGVTSLKFNNWIDVPFSVVSATRLTFVVPSLSQGTYSISVSNGVAAATATTAFTYTGGLMTQFLPQQGRPGTSVQLLVFYLNPVQSVRFGNVTATFTEQAGGSSNGGRVITATVPPTATTGNITVTDNAGTYAISQSAFTVPFAIDSYEGTNGYGVIGQSLTIRGSALANVTRVSFSRYDGSAPVNVTALTKAADGSLSLTVPATLLPDSSYLLSVYDATQTPSELWAAWPITILRLPTISSFTPTSGGIGTVVTVNGTGLSHVSHATFNGVESPEIISVSETRLTMKVPPLASTGRLRVETVVGTVQSTTNFTFTPPPPPTITSFSPTSGQPGTTVTITGTNLSNATAVSINGVAAEPAYFVATATQLSFQVPGNATTGPIRVQTTSGSVQSTANFTVLTTPTFIIDSVNAVPGQQVTIPVRVRDFTSLLGFSGTLSFGDPAVSIVRITQIHSSVSSLSYNSFGSGARVMWYAATTTPVTLAANTVLFAVVVNVGAGATAWFPGGVNVVHSNLQTGTALASAGAVVVDPFYARADVNVGVTYGSATGPALNGYGAELRNAVSDLRVDTQGVALSPTLIALTGATGQSYRVVPKATGGAYASIGDLVRTHRHVLNATPLGQNTKVLAADVDGSKSVTSTDVALMADVLLGRRSTYPKGRRVRFFNAATLSASTTAPWTFDTTATVSNLTAAGASVNFIAVRLGDVSLSAARPALSTPLAVEMPNATVGIGQLLTLPVRFGGARADLAGVQLTLNWDPAVLRLTQALPVLPGLQTHQPDAGHLTLLWTEAALAGRAVAAGDALVQLSFEAVGTVGTSTVVQFDGGRAVATNATLDLVPLTFTDGVVQISSAVTGVAGTAEAERLMLHPNPAKAETAVRLTGVVPGHPIVLLDAAGRIVRTLLPPAASGVLSLHGLAPGVYVVRAGEQCRRLVVQ